MINRFDPKAAVLIVCLGVIVLAQAAESWREPEDFRGLKWGATEAEALRLHPTLKKVPMPTSPADSAHYALLNTKVGDVSVTIGFSFLHGAFSQAFLSFPSKDYATIEAAFIERYGVPTKTSEEIVSNRLGAKFTNQKHQWIGQNISIYLSRYSSSVATGTAVLGTKAYFDAFGANKSQRSKDAAKDL